MRHLAVAVTDEERSRRFYERYLGFDAEPPRRYLDGTLMLYDAKASRSPSAERKSPPGRRASSTSASASRAPMTYARSAPA
jgi:hypothetical protein